MRTATNRDWPGRSARAATAAKPTGHCRWASDWVKRQPRPWFWWIAIWSHSPVRERQIRPPVSTSGSIAPGLTFWPGVPLADREGEIISTTLGARSAIMLSHHGMLTVGRSVQEAVVLAVTMERSARIQVRAAALGGVKPIGGEDVRKARDFLR